MTIPSNYVKTSKNGRIMKSIIGAVTITGNTLFINDQRNELIVALKFDSEDDAQLELLSINEQLDAPAKGPRR